MKSIHHLIKLSLFLVVLLIAFHTVDGNRKKCRWYEYYDRDSKSCQECGICSKGTRVVTTCTSKSNIVCEPCPMQTFSKYSSKTNTNCRKCSDCGEREVLKNCTRKEDTVCGKCPPEMYFDHISLKCQSCSYCYPEYSDDGLNLYHVSECAKLEMAPDYQCMELIDVPNFPTKPNPSNESQSQQIIEDLMMKLKPLHQSMMTSPTFANHLQTFTMLLAIICILLSFSIILQLLSFIRKPEPTLQYHQIMPEKLI